MCNQSNTSSADSRPAVYQIRVQGRLGNEWTERFHGMSITPEESGHTLLTGPVVDQAALYGLLRTVRDLGLPLLSVRRLPPEQIDSSDSGE
jgi:hypothetical protein